MYLQRMIPEAAIRPNNGNLVDVAGFLILYKYIKARYPNFFGNVLFVVSETTGYAGGGIP